MKLFKTINPKLLLIIIIMLSMIFVTPAAAYLVRTSGCVTDVINPAYGYYLYGVNTSVGRIRVADNFYLPVGTFVQVLGQSGTPVFWSDIVLSLPVGHPFNPCPYNNNF